MTLHNDTLRDHAINLRAKVRRRVNSRRTGGVADHARPCRLADGRRLNNVGLIFESAGAGSHPDTVITAK